MTEGTHMRSYLFVPGDSPRKQQKALTSGADALILDLEDSVAPTKKADARTITADFLAERAAAITEKSPKLIVRINPLQSEIWEADLATIVPQKPHAIFLPKARNGADLARLDTALTALESEHGLAVGSISVLALVTELPIALLAMESFATPPVRVTGYSWGAEDLSAEIGAQTKRDQNGVLTDPYRLARSLCLLAASAAGIGAIDTVYTAFRDLAGLEKEARAAVRDGFSGKLAIHPAQVPPINAAFTPTSDEIARAQAIVAAFAESDDTGVVALDGQMLDRPHLRHAETLLARARQAGVI